MRDYDSDMDMRDVAAIRKAELALDRREKAAERSEKDAKRSIAEALRSNPELKKKLVVQFGQGIRESREYSPNELAEIRKQLSNPYGFGTDDLPTGFEPKVWDRD